MENNKFKLINRIVAIAVFAMSAFVYLATIEPTASFWDCGEFIASSYKLEVGHPPGNPSFNLFGRLFTMFTGAEHAAAAINAMSALCSALTIFFLYLTIVHFGRRILEKRGREMTTGSAIGIFAAGVIGAMAYCFSDTFWFSAVEGEVYAMSSLFTAVVFWAILKWEEEADSKYANRWIILISLLMGISIGVHLLNLLTIPAIVFIIYYKRKAKETVTFRQAVGVLALSGVILGVLLFGIIPYLPKIMAFFDRIFVNGFGLPFNVGAAFFMVLVMALCFGVLQYFRGENKPIAHTITLSLTTFLIGYSIFAITIIRSCANTPTNEYQPDNPYTLVRYLGREQYGSTPILYGQAYTDPYDVKSTSYYTPLNGRYYKAENIVPEYAAGGKMLFPRMWNGFDERHKQFYDSYAKHKRYKRVKVGDEYTTIQMPSFGDNMKFFFEYQVGYMYFRYFFWNFVGRQNDFHGQVPGDLLSGNWESGIPAFDNARLGDQSEAPAILRENKAKNHYFFLPLILGLIGLIFQIEHDKRNSWVTGLLFFLTGLAIVIYLNQPPYQVRERDYAYAGSFYVFALWIGLGVLAVKEWMEKATKKEIPSALAATVICLGIPVIMGCENWDDHDRSGRYTARDMAFNHLMSTDKDAILVTHGDNDTFPLWYAQEVESMRTDVRIMNTSLLGTDWYIDQMKRRQYESAPIEIDIPRVQYLYGTNDFPYVMDFFNGQPILARDAIEIFKEPRYKLDGKADFIPSKRLLIPVDKENVRKYGIVPEEDMDKVVDTVELVINSDRIGKTDLIILDYLSNYKWDRPFYYVTPNADVNLGLDRWSQYNGFCYKFVPVLKSEDDPTHYIDADLMYDRLMNVFRFETLACQDVYYDYQNIYTFCAVVPIRDMFYNTAYEMYMRGDREKCVALLDRCVKVMPASNFPYNISWMRSINEYTILRMVELYLMAGEKDKALAVADQYVKETVTAIRYFNSDFHGEALSERFVKDNLSLLAYLTEMLEQNGMESKAVEYQNMLM